MVVGVAEAVVASGVVVVVAVAGLVVVAVVDLVVVVELVRPVFDDDNANQPLH